MSEAKEYDDVFKIAEAIPKSKFQSILRFLTLDKSEKQWHNYDRGWVIQTLHKAKCYHGKTHHCQSKP